MATVTFRLPDEVRRRMAELDLDWPEKVRSFIEAEIEHQDRLEALGRARAFRRRHAAKMRGVSLSAEVVRSRREDH